MCGCWCFIVGDWVVEGGWVIVVVFGVDWLRWVWGCGLGFLCLGLSCEVWLVCVVVGIVVGL